MDKIKIAFFDFAGCEGCQLTIIDALQSHLDILDVVEIVQFREAMSEKGDDYQVAFIEGSCTRPEDEERLFDIRSQAEKVISLGACAHLGGVNGMTSWQSLEHAWRYVYGQTGKFNRCYTPKPIGSVIPVDFYIPGCPINPGEVIQAIKALLLGITPQIPEYPVCVECKLDENICVVPLGQVCLGSITRAGCGAICPKNSLGCYGCRGMMENANVSGLKIALRHYGSDEIALNDCMRLFQSLQINTLSRETVA